MRDDRAADSGLHLSGCRDGSSLIPLKVVGESTQAKEENEGLRMLAKLIAREIESSDLTGDTEGGSVTPKEA